MQLFFAAFELKISDFLWKHIGLVFKTASSVCTRSVIGKIHFVVILVFFLGLCVKTFRSSGVKILVRFPMVNFTCPEAIHGKFFFENEPLIFVFFSSSAKNFRTLAKKIWHVCQNYTLGGHKKFLTKNTFLERWTYSCTLKIRAKDYQTVRKTFSHGFENFVFGVQR